MCKRTAVHNGEDVSRAVSTGDSRVCRHRRAVAVHLQGAPLARHTVHETFQRSRCLEPAHPGTHGTQRPRKQPRLLRTCTDGEQSFPPVGRARREARFFAETQTGGYG